MMEEGTLEIKKAISTKAKIFGYNHYLLSDLYLILGNCLASKQYYSDAYDYFDKGYSVLR